ncbi:hypothetical protein [Chitinilyticum litopenaei]|uniref:hypothetical protein n=1 Tax=Chitinilyticum litopenaei TaxID=1121276 RepID=UPI001185F044|nr:hypothetical protein [Chitinilyticum litopenaei]
MWQAFLDTLDAPETIEYGAYQRETKPGTPLWRRPTRGKRFENLFSALFGEQGARRECLGRASYAKRYAQNEELAMPYVAAWVRGSPHALLVRSSAPHPEVTIVESAQVDQINAQSEEELTNYLSDLFGRGAHEFGVRLLKDQEVSLP